jgi:hypothetical protein
LGIFDTVGMRGIPTRRGVDIFQHNKRYGFHDIHLGVHVNAARHAFAIDEVRNTFPLTPWTNLNVLNKGALHADDAPYQQRWFLGQHGDVGGGLQESTLSDIPLKWVADGAQKRGLVFLQSTDAPLNARCNRPCEPMHDVTTPKGLGFLGHSARFIGLWNRAKHRNKNGDPLPMPKGEAATLEEMRIHLHYATRFRLGLDRKYFPAPLKQFLSPETVQQIGDEIKGFPNVETYAKHLLNENSG